MCRGCERFNGIDYEEDVILSKVFTTSNPSETDSYCSTIIYNGSLNNHRDKTGLEELPENKEIVSYNFGARRKNTFSSSSISPDNGETDSDHIGTERARNFSREKYTSSSQRYVELRYEPISTWLT